MERATRSLTIFKWYTATVCFGYPIGFFLAPHGWLQLVMAYAVVGIFVIMFDLWFGSLSRWKKILWSVLIVLFNIVFLPVYWCVVLKGKERKKENELILKHLTSLDDSIACGLLAILLGPFAVLPGISLAHYSLNKSSGCRSRDLRTRMACAFILNYLMCVVWTWVIVNAVQRFLSI